MEQIQGKNALFYDTEFRPLDNSVYNHAFFERPLDIAIHWRRPSEFLSEAIKPGNLNKLGYMNTTPQQINTILGRDVLASAVEVTQIHVFYDSIEPADI